MDKVLVAIFESEPKAYEGLTALRELHQAGDISLYGAAVIVKDADGTVATRRIDESGPAGTLTGLLVGGLVGLIGGPVGAAVGASLGGFGGAMYDLFEAGVDLDFVADVSRTLTPGSAAVVADLDEAWVTPVDTRLAPLGGTMLRRPKGEVTEELINRQAAVTGEELSQLRAELAAVPAEARAGVQKRIDAAEAKLAALEGRIAKARADRTAEFEAKLAKLRKQRDEAADRDHALIEGRIAALTAAYEARNAKLMEAADLSQRARELSSEARQIRSEALKQTVLV